MSTEYNKEYYANNRQRTSEQLLCETCQTLISRSCVSRHNRSRHHLSSLKVREIMRKSVELEETAKRVKANQDRVATTMTRHEDMKREIYRLVGLHDFLIDQIHQQKAVFKKNKYKLRCEGTEWYYSALFFRKKRHTGLDFFPCEFKGTADTILNAELTADEIGDFSYYGDDQDYNFQFDQYRLDSSACMTHNDKQVIGHFMQELAELCLKFEDWCSSHACISHATKKKFNKFMTKLPTIVVDEL